MGHGIIFSVLCYSGCYASCGNFLSKAESYKERTRGGFVMKEPGSSAPV